VGEIGRIDQISQLRPQFQSDDPSVAFWSCWSAGLLGDLNAVAALKRFISMPEYAGRVLDIVLRRRCRKRYKAWRSRNAFHCSSACPMRYPVACWPKA
jgi:hypothetical protein